MESPSVEFRQVLVFLVMEENKIYVAVGKDVEQRESALNWALKFSKGETICVIHVHVPAQRIPQPNGFQAPLNAVSEVEIKAFHEWEKNEVVKMLDDCLKLCALKQVPSEILCIQKESITDGILELINQLGIQKLVMGAGGKNKKWRIKVPNSRKSNYVLKCAPSFCHIWFISRDRLIYTRKGMKQLNRLSVHLEENQYNRLSDSESFYSPPAESVGSSSPLAQSTLNEFPPAGELTTIMNTDLFDGLEQALAEAEAEASRQKATEESETRHKAEKEARKRLETYYNVKANVEEVTQTTTKIKSRHVEQNEVSKILPQADVELSSLGIHIKDCNVSGENLEEELLFTDTLQRYTRQCNEVQLESGNAVRTVRVLKKQVSQEPSSLTVPKFFCEFTQLDLEEATQFFDPSLIIERGSYGSVYKGYLYHTELAIKTYNHSLQGTAEFEREVDVLSKLRHPNLVTLIGACPDSMSLIYEYLPNGNLEDRLNCKDNTLPIPWQTRIRIATELCSVLYFLHSIQPCSIIHGDLNPKNVLLDASFSCKLSGFGSCHIISTVTTKALNLLEAGHLSPKSDVYSFGILLLRLLTGKPSLKIAQEVQHALENDHLHNILDPSAGDWPVVRAKQFAYIALKCCDVNPKHRPDLGSEVWSVLKPVVTPRESLASPLQLLSEDEVPSHFICPIFQEMMRDPHFAADGFTYEGDAIRGWFEGGNNSSPMTNLKLNNQNLTPNRALRSAIQDWLQQHRHS